MDNRLVVDVIGGIGSVEGWDRTHSSLRHRHARRTARSPMHGIESDASSHAPAWCGVHERSDAHHWMRDRRRAPEQDVTSGGRGPDARRPAAARNASLVVSSRAWSRISRDCCASAAHGSHIIRSPGRKISCSPYSTSYSYCTGTLLRYEYCKSTTL